MKIEIKYNSTWQNSFLSGSNNEPLPKGGRKYIASGKGLSTNFMKQNITNDTIMGILLRVCGYQCKLYQARNNMFTDNYYFKDIESKLSFENTTTISNEVVYLRNISGNKDPSRFIGMLKTNDALFNSEYSSELWSVLELNFDKLCDFILDDHIKINSETKFEPLVICDLFDEINKQKQVKIDTKITDVINVLCNSFPNNDYIEKNGKIKTLRFYCSAIYLQLNRLVKDYNGCIPGISKRNFTKQDLMSKFTTGKVKKVYGNPYIKNEIVKGQGKLTTKLTKANGTLNISIDIDKNKALELKDMIECAGVGAFYVGKKGLGFIKNIRI